MYCPITQCLKYQRFTGCRIRKFEFVAKSQILRMDWEETNNLKFRDGDGPNLCRVKK